jgi:hypothetical protein
MIWSPIGILSHLIAEMIPVWILQNCVRDKTDHDACHYCLSFFLWILITPLLSSNSSIQYNRFWLPLCYLQTLLYNTIDSDYT